MTLSLAILTLFLPFQGADAAWNRFNKILAEDQDKIVPHDVHRRSARYSALEMLNGAPYEFEHYVEDFGKKYEDDEFQTRQNLFEQNLALIKSHNLNHQKKLVGWRMHVNKFTDMTKEEFRAHTRGFHHQLFNHMRKEKQAAAAAKQWKQEEFGRQPIDIGPPPVNMTLINSLPKNVDWRYLDSDIKQQGGCGSCWAFAATEVIEAHLRKNNLSSIPKNMALSTQQLASCTPNTQHCGGTGGCAGATCQLAFEYLKQNGGHVLEAQYPYRSMYGETGQCKSKEDMGVQAVQIGGFVELESNDYNALMEAVANHGPVAISVDASNWQFYDGGVYKGDCGTDVDHAVVLVGYGHDEDEGDYWLIRNSWGFSWGENGYIKLRRSFATDQHCGMDETPLNGYACEGNDEPIQVCGMCGILSSSSYPTDVKVKDGIDLRALLDSSSSSSSK